MSDRRGERPQSEAAEKAASSSVAVPNWTDRPLDRTLISLSFLAACLLGLLEICSGPQLATRIILSFCYKLASTTGYNAIYDWPSSWRGWYSLEIGVEITTAITLGFLVWLLFALVYDAAGILVGLVPSSVTSIVILTFRFHIRSYILLGIIPIVGVQAVVAARILDRRWYEQEAERASARFHRALRGSGRGTSRRSRSGAKTGPSPSAGVVSGGAYSRSDDRQLSSRGHRADAGQHRDDADGGVVALIDSANRRPVQSGAELRVSPR